MPSERRNEGEGIREEKRGENKEGEMKEKKRRKTRKEERQNNWII